MSTLLDIQVHSNLCKNNQVSINVLSALDNNYPQNQQAMMMLVHSWKVQCNQNQVYCQAHSNIKHLLWCLKSYDLFIYFFK